MKLGYMEESLLSIEDVATQLVTSVRRIRRFVASGQLPATQVVNRYYVKKDALSEFCAKYATFDSEELGTSLKQIRRYVASGQLAEW